MKKISRVPEGIVTWNVRNINIRLSLTFLTFQASPVGRWCPHFFKKVIPAKPPTWTLTKSCFSNLSKNHCFSNYFQLALPKICSPFFVCGRTINLYWECTRLVIFIFTCSSALIGAIVCILDHKHVASLVNSALFNEQLPQQIHSISHEPKLFTKNVGDLLTLKIRNPLNVVSPCCIPAFWISLNEFEKTNIIFATCLYCMTWLKKKIKQQNVGTKEYFMVWFASLKMTSECLLFRQLGVKIHQISWRLQKTPG